MIMFPGITQLDLTGPLEVLSSVPDWKVELVAHTMEPVVSGARLQVFTHSDVRLRASVRPAGGPRRPGCRRRDFG
jgi:hypothetical protein